METKKTNLEEQKVNLNQNKLTEKLLQSGNQVKNQPLLEIPKKTESLQPDKNEQVKPSPALEVPLEKVSEVAAKPETQPEQNKIVNVQLDTDPQPLKYPDMTTIDALVQNPNLFLYENKLLDDVTSNYIRFSLTKFLYNTMGKDCRPELLTQKDLDYAIENGFKV